MSNFLYTIRRTPKGKRLNVDCYASMKPTKRRAKCTQCDLETRSDSKLPFYKKNKDKKSDEYYCGCNGWD